MVRITPVNPGTTPKSAPATRPKSSPTAKPAASSSTDRHTASASSGSEVARSVAAVQEFINAVVDAASPEGEQAATQDWAAEEHLNKRQAAEVETSVDRAIENKTSKYECSSCRREWYFSMVCPLVPKWFSWQGSFVQICYECAQMKSGPPGPWTITSATTQNGAVRLGAMTTDRMIVPPMPEAPGTGTASAMSRPPDKDEWAIVPYNPDLDTMHWTTVAMPTDPQAPFTVQCAVLRDGSWFRKPWFEGDDASTLKQFKKAARHSWLQHQAMLKGVFEKRARGMTYQRHIASIAEEHPGADLSSQAKRRLLMKRGKDWMSTAVCGLSADPPACSVPGTTEEEKIRLRSEKRQQVKAVFNEWEQLTEYAATHAGWQPALAGRLFPINDAFQFQAQITDGLANYFFCDGCDAFCPPDEWFGNGGQFRCPNCTKQYQPYAGGRKAQKVWVLEVQDDKADDLEDFLKAPEQSTASARAVQAVSAPGAPAASRTEFFLAEWEDTTTQNLSDGLKAIMIGVAAELPVLSFEQLSKHVSETADKCKRKAFFEPRRMTQANINWMSEMNTKGKNITRPWSWIGDTVNLGKVTQGDSRLGDPPYGYGTNPTQADVVLKAIPEWRACKIVYDENTPVMKQADIIRFWAYSKFCYEALVSVIEHDGALPEA